MARRESIPPSLGKNHIQLTCASLKVTVSLPYTHEALRKALLRYIHSISLRDIRDPGSPCATRKRKATDIITAFPPPLPQVASDPGEIEVPIRRP